MQAAIAMSQRAKVASQRAKEQKKKKTFHDKFMKNLMNNTPHSGQFDEDL